jgi:AraC-like DNA-binding protein
MTTTPSTAKNSAGRRRERDAFSDKEAAKMLGIPVSKLYRICDFFDSDPDDPWDLNEGDFFEYEPGQARKRRFYEEGVMAIAKYLEETEGGSFLARLKEFFTHHRARVTRALVQRRIIQVTQDRSSLVIRGDLVFLQQRSVVRVLGTNGKGMSGTLRRIDEESSGLDGAEGLEIDVHFADFEDAEGRHWSQRGIARLARTMQERGRITKARKAWVKAVADVAEDCFEVQRKVLESHEARVKAAMTRARNKAKHCAVTQQKPNAADRNPIELEAHHLFDAASRPDLAALEDNLLVISSALHRNFHKWMGSRPCDPKDFVDYLLRNELTHFEGSPSTRARQEARQQQLMHRLEMLQARYEGNRLLY